VSRTRAGAARPAAGIGGAAVDLIDRLTRQVGRVVLVDITNTFVGDVNNPLDIQVVSGGQLIDPRGPSLLHVTATGAVNAPVTATLPAAGVGLFHYVTAIQLVKLYNVIGVAAGAGVIISSSNLPGTPNWTTEQLASPAGTAITVIDLVIPGGLRSAVANTATTFIAPQQLQTIWRWNVSYRVAT